MLGGRIIAFLADNNVPDSICDYLTTRGHDVTRVRDALAADTADPVIAEAAIRDGQVLISWDKDFNAQRYMRPRLAALQRVAFCCSYPEALARIEVVIGRLEYEVSKSTTECPLLFRIGKDRIQIRV